ncbi:MAG: hypothetical protein IJ860_02565 [Eubacterium sp.]|nr:hypothetical protein [Eubacterium sp.]
MGKVLFINGSPNEHGCTATAMEEVISTLEKNGIESEIYSNPKLRILSSTGMQRLLI